MYARNEQVLLDWEGKILQLTSKRRRVIEEHDNFASSVEAHIDSVVASMPVIESHFQYPAHDEMFAILSSLDATLTPEKFANHLHKCQAYSHFAMSIGSTELYNSDDLFISAAHAETLKGVDPVSLSKVWKIDVATAKRTLKATSQRRRIDVDNSLSHNLSTNDRIIRYKSIY